MSYIWASKVVDMKKANYPQKGKSGTSRVQEPMSAYKTTRVIPALKDFTYNEFKKIADKTPFTQLEWASMLHISERTLQRYAKSNGSFAAINAERALQINKVIREGKAAFGKTENFYQWLKEKPSTLEGMLSLESLQSYDGIEKVLTALGRIQHGIFA